MELKIKFKLAMIIIAFFFTLICIDWYSNMDYVNVVKREDSRKLTDKELLEARSTYTVDPSKEYIWESYRTVKYTKGNFPFIFNEEVLERTNDELKLNKY
jgi:hypothetical protein